jgi:hypothetical protein
MLMKRGMIIVLLMLLGLRLGFSQVSSVSQAQSMFIYNFSRLIQWPAGSINGEFVIGVVGDNELYSSLLSFVANKKVGQQAISVKKFDEPQSITRCQIVFVGDGKISRLNEVISKLQGSNSLLITERRGMVNSGSAIDFYMVEDKLRFAMNTSNAEKYDLVVSKSLVDMANN